MKTRSSGLGMAHLALVALACGKAETPAPPAPAAVAAGTPAPAASPGASKMDRDEEASESIANWLLDLAAAIREQRFEAVPAYFAEDFVGDLPAEPTGGAKPAVPGAETLTWELPADGKDKLRRGDTAETFRRWFGRWSAFDHLLFKVKGAEIVAEAPLRVSVRLQVQVVAARAGSGPEEMYAWWNTTVVAGPDKEKDPWRIAAIVPEPATSIVAASPLFAEVSRSAGIARRSPRFGTQGNLNFNWQGVAAADFDRDGFQDLFVPGFDVNRLYRNLGTGRFEEVAAACGAALPQGGTGALVFDMDGDGDDDLLVSRVGSQVLLENRIVPDGKLAFHDVSTASGIGDRPANGFTAAAADIDNDGDLDVHVASYNLYGDVMPDSWFDAKNGTPNLLFLNDGKGHFREVAREAGMTETRWSYSGAFADYDNDGDQDLFVANDFGPDNLYRNKGDGTFEDVAVALGVADPGNGMGVAWGDYDGDGLLDLYIMDMSSTAGTRILKRLFPKAEGVQATLLRMASGNSLFRNNGDGTFEDVSKKAGGVGAQWAWGGGFLDIDNDLCDDLFVANGFITGKSAKDT